MTVSPNSSDMPAVRRVVEHPLVPGLFLLPEPRCDDYLDTRTCARCGRVIGYARAALRCGPLDIVHGTVEFDCTDNRNW